MFCKLKITEMNREEMRTRLREKLDGKKQLRTKDINKDFEPVKSEKSSTPVVKEVKEDKEDKEVKVHSEAEDDSIVSALLAEDESGSDFKFPDSETESMVKNLSKNPDIKKIVEDVSNNPDIMDFISNEIKDPKNLKNMIGEMTKNKSIFNEELLTNPELLKYASDPNIIKQALNMMKNNPDFLKNFSKK